MTNVQTDAEGMQIPVAEAFQNLATNLNAAFTPAGLAFAVVLFQPPAESADPAAEMPSLFASNASAEAAARALEWHAERLRTGRIAAPKNPG